MFDHDVSIGICDQCDTIAHLTHTPDDGALCTWCFAEAGHEWDESMDIAIQKSEDENA